MNDINFIILVIYFFNAGHFGCYLLTLENKI